MWKCGQVSRLVGFISSMVFSASIIFLCSFGMVGIFNALSEYGLDDFDKLAMQDADSIVATITGISIDEAAVENELVNDMKNIIYGFENKSDYTFDEATKDAETVLSHVFGNLGDMNVEESIYKLKESFSGLFNGSIDEDAIKGYIREYTKPEEY